MRKKTGSLNVSLQVDRGTAIAIKNRAKAEGRPLRSVFEQMANEYLKRGATRDNKKKG